MSILLLNPKKKTGLPKNGLVALYDAGRQILEGTTGQQLIDYSGRGNHAQLGSTSGADTNDPSWSGAGLAFGADDYCNSSITKNTFNWNSGHTVISVCKNPSSNGYLKFLWYVGNHVSLSPNYHSFAIYFKNADVKYYSYDGTVMDMTSLKTGTYSCYGGIYSPGKMLIWNGTQKVQRKFTVNTNISESANLKLGASQSNSNCLTDGDFYYFVVYNRALSDAEYLRAYNYLKKLMANRGITI